MTNRSTTKTGSDSKVPLTEQIKRDSNPTNPRFQAQMVEAKGKQTPTIEPDNRISPKKATDKMSVKDVAYAEGRKPNQGGDKN